MHDIAAMPQLAATDVEIVVDAPCWSEAPGAGDAMREIPGEPFAKAAEEVSTSGSGPVITLGRLPAICAVVVWLGASSESVSIWIALPFWSITWLPVRWSTRTRPWAFWAST